MINLTILILLSKIACSGDHHTSHSVERVYVERQRIQFDFAVYNRDVCEKINFCKLVMVIPFDFIFRAKDVCHIVDVNVLDSLGEDVDCPIAYPSR